MKTIRRYFLLLPVLIGLAVIATSCDDNDSPEDPILRPLEQHIQGVWQEWKSYEVKDGKYIETPNPEGHMLEHDLRPGGEMIISYSSVSYTHLTLPTT